MPTRSAPSVSVGTIATTFVRDGERGAAIVPTLRGRRPAIRDHPAVAERHKTDAPRIDCRRWHLQQRQRIALLDRPDLELAVAGHALLGVDLAEQRLEPRRDVVALPQRV